MQAGFFERPSRAQIAHLALGEIWHPFESRDRDHVVCSLAIVVIPTASEVLPIRHPDGFHLRFDPRHLGVTGMRPPAREALIGGSGRRHSGSPALRRPSA
jgi:hypothetical protein